MSAGPKSVEPVSRPETVITADIIRCSMKGRAMTTSIGSHLPSLIFVMMPATAPTVPIAARLHTLKSAPGLAAAAVPAFSPVRKAVAFSKAAPPASRPK
jgi:hypothetical protein